jgi:L-cysteine:1D-myo-inositol 2-amino-2-deoxy-alpha-D-glucopyranoside ligase
MAMEYLGTTIDIHGGGLDLIFPHHEAEIAQSEGVTGRQFARVWMHTGMLRYEGEKMSKSLGNVVLLAQLLKRHTPNSLRLMLLLHHYRSSWEYTEAEAMAGAALANALHTPGTALVDVNGLRQRFYSALNDDLNTAQAVRTLTGLAAGAQNPAANEALREMGAVLGLHIADGRVTA